jgi:hypothetical protein
MFRVLQESAHRLQLKQSGGGFEGSGLAETHIGRSAPAKPKLVVLNIELTGDLGGPQITAEHAARLKTESAILRRELESSGL